MESAEFVTELIPHLPDDLGLQCMSRSPYSTHRVASRVCRRWSQLLSSLDFYYHRRKLGYTHKVACLVQAINGYVSPDGEKSGCNSASYGITVFDSVSRTWERVDPIPEYPNGLPLFCQLASCEGKLVVMGGWDPASYEPLTRVFIYDFMERRWRRGKDMPSRRSFFGIGSFSSRVYLAGGHDENKNALRTGWVYDLREDEWTELAQMSQERDECEGVVIGTEFWVVSGYGTDRQGAFEENAEVYDFGSGQWRRVENVWKSGGCPRSCVGIGNDEKLVNWGELDPAILVGACGVGLGSRVLITGSEHQGFYLVEMKDDGKNWKFEKINVPEEFSGVVQSGCCVEI